MSTMTQSTTNEMINYTLTAEVGESNEPVTLQLFRLGARAPLWTKTTEFDFASKVWVQFQLDQEADPVIVRGDVESYLMSHTL